MAKPPRRPANPGATTTRRRRTTTTRAAEAPVKGGGALSLLAPVMAVLAAILPAVVDWEIETQGIVLLLVLGALGLALAKIPHHSYSWRVQPGTPSAALKQTIGTMRTIVTIVLVVLILTVLASSQTIIGRLPDEIARLVEPAISSGQRDVIALRLQQLPERRDGMNMYFGRLVAAGENAQRASLKGDAIVAKQSTPGSAETSVIYVVSAPTIMRGLLERTLLPTFFQFAWIGAILAGLFIAGIYFMELMGNFVREYQLKNNGSAQA